MNSSRRSVLGVIGKATLVAVAAPVAFLSTDGCTTQQTASNVRSLEQSGRISFVCLAAPGTTPSPGLPIGDCSSTRYEVPEDYGVVDGKTTKPHLYGLVTQTTRGEVAVIDMSTKTEPVLDQNPRVPGANFLPIAAQPTDIVSTPDGDATFVGVAEIGRQGIFALPSRDIRPCADCAPKTLTNWTACALPGAPGRMVIVDDPAVDGKMRASCDAPYEVPAELGVGPDGNDLIDVTDAFEKDGEEKVLKGRPKIVTTIPELGAIAIIDAQRLFDVEEDASGKVSYVHPPGSWKQCPIDRWVLLNADVPVQNPPPAGTGGPACVDRPVDPPPTQVSFDSRPAGIVRTLDTLYVADTSAPVIHVLDMKTPCDPVERDPLLPTSLEDPARVVTTNAISASGLLGSLKAFLYASDDYDGTLMAFDISPGSKMRNPIARPHPEWTPAQPSDRVDYGVPIQDLILIERDVPQTVPATGVSVEGVRCDPNPDLTVCTADSTSCDLETLYRTGANFDRGAGPSRLRGAFAYALLSTGQIAVVDVDDYDAQCRLPGFPSHLNGCPDDRILPPKEEPESTKVWAGSGEASCNVVVPHSPRAATYMRSSDLTGQNQPGLQGFPALYDNQGALQSSFDPDGIIMRATLPDPAVKSVQFTLAVSSAVFPIDPATGLVKNGNELEHTVAANLEDPRAHTTTQSFSVIFEGAIPGFVGKAAKMRSADNPPTLSDAASRFCDQGVLGKNAFKEILRDEDPLKPEKDVDDQARNYADYVQISSTVPPEDDPYWTSGSQGICSFDQCNLTFGPLEIPKTTRDVKIIEAYQDHLELELPPDVVADVDDSSKTIAVADLVGCCFPSLVSFNVRVGNQWVVLGTTSGFFHHVVPTPEASATQDRPLGACRNTCDARDARKNGRIRSLPHDEIITDGDKGAFINPFLRFAINEAINGHPLDGNPDSPTDNAPRRGTFFQFNTQGSFNPLRVSLTATTSDIQPQYIGFVEATGEVVVTDGSLEGVILLQGSSLDITRRYY